MATTPCTIAWYPLNPGESRAAFGYHSHDPSLGLGLIPDELLTAHPNCIVRPGETRLEYDPATGIIYETILTVPGQPPRRLVPASAAALSPAAAAPSLVAAAAAAPSDWVAL